MKIRAMVPTAEGQLEEREVELTEEQAQYVWLATIPHTSFSTMPTRGRVHANNPGPITLCGVDRRDESDGPIFTSMEKDYSGVTCLACLNHVRAAMIVERKLDPRPYWCPRCELRYAWPSDNYPGNTHVSRFDPRPEFSQNRADYLSGGDPQ